VCAQLWGFAASPSPSHLSGRTFFPPLVGLLQPLFSLRQTTSTVICCLAFLTRLFPPPCHLELFAHMTRAVALEQLIPSPEWMLRRLRAPRGVAFD